MINQVLIKNPLNWAIIYLMVLLGYMMFNMILVSIKPDADMFSEN